MSQHYSKAALQAIGAEVPAPALRRNLAERAFGLPPAMFVATIGAYLAFLLIMAAAFMNRELVLPFAIFFIYVAMAFGVPGLWARIMPRPSGRYQSWSEFRAEGMEIATGRIGGDAAIAQVLALPVLIVGWAVATAIIVAFV